MSTNWADCISFIRPHRDVRTKLIEQLNQDGLTGPDIHVPALGSEELLQLLKDAESFAKEVGVDRPACPVRAGRWLHRMAVTITKKSFADLPLTTRQAIAHAAIVVGGRPDLLR